MRCAWSRVRDCPTEYLLVRLVSIGQAALPLGPLCDKLVNQSIHSISPRLVLEPPQVYLRGDSGPKLGDVDNSQFYGGLGSELKLTILAAPTPIGSPDFRRPSSISNMPTPALAYCTHPYSSESQLCCSGVANTWADLALTKGNSSYCVIATPMDLLFMPSRPAGDVVFEPRISYPTGGGHPERRLAYGLVRKVIHCT